MEAKMEDKGGAQERTDKPKRAAARKRPKRSVAPGRQVGSDTAKRAAAVVLEVLGGVRRPADAAKVLGVSVMRYYVIESRALQGLVEACEARPRGPRRDPSLHVAKLERRIETLQNEAIRYQALARASHRAIGIAPVKKDPPRKAGSKRRRPTVRALKAARGLRSSTPEVTSAAPAKT